MGRVWSLAMSYPLHRLMSVLSLTMSIIMAANVSASSIINGTRFIYPSDEREITVQVDNKNSYPVLLQSWIDDGHSQIEPEKMNVPFILTPPLTRVEAGKGQTLRINYIGADLSPDREHVFWLNVLEIPPNEKDTKNHLQVAFRSRLKLFWRPSQLSNGAATAQEKLSWKVAGDSIIIKNPTPYYITLAAVSITHNGKKTIVNGSMIEPMGTTSLKNYINVNSTDKVEAEYINDFGAHKSITIKYLP